MRKEIGIRILLGYGTLYAMRRHKAWRGGSKAQQSCDPATALGTLPLYMYIAEWKDDFAIGS